MLFLEIAKACFGGERKIDQMIKRITSYFTRGEIVLYIGSVCAIIASFCIFDRENYLTLIASLIGVTSLIFAAKGNPVSQVLMVVFSLLYGIISLGFAYYGEMITYVGMTLPMSVTALVSWLKNPYKGKRSQVAVNRIRARELPLMIILTVAVTVAFYFILSVLNTANILPSTLSVTTSFLAVYLTFRRSPYYALAYAANDVVLIVLWVWASFNDRSYIAVVVCFVAFLFNDIYGFLSWRRMERLQKEQ